MPAGLKPGQSRASAASSQRQLPMFGGGFDVFADDEPPRETPQPNIPKGPHPLAANGNKAIPVWLVCECPWRQRSWRLRMLHPALPKLYVLSPTVLQEIDERMASMQLDKVELVRHHPGEEVYHRHYETIAGLAVLRLQDSGAPTSTSVRGRH